MIIKTKRNVLFQEGFIIAYLTFLGYLIAYLFQLGFARYFKIDHDFVFVSISSILFSISIVVITLVIILVLFDATFMLTSNKHIRKIIIYVLMGLIYLGLNGFENILLIGAVTVIFLILELIEWRCSGKENSKVAKEKEEYPGLSFIKKIFGEKVYLTVIFTLFICAMAFQIGSYTASNKKHFLVISSEPEYVVLKVYEDTIISASLIRENKSITLDYMIFKIGDEEIQMRLEEVGPLKVNSEKNLSSR